MKCAQHLLPLLEAQSMIVNSTMSKRSRTPQKLRFLSSHPKFITRMKTLSTLLLTLLWTVFQTSSRQETLTKLMDPPQRLPSRSLPLRSMSTVMINSRKTLFLSTILFPAKFSKLLLSNSALNARQCQLLLKDTTMLLETPCSSKELLIESSTSAPQSTLMAELSL